MIETLRPTTLEMLKPNAEDRSSRTNQQLGYLIGDYFGLVGLCAYKQLKRGVEMSPIEAREINKYVFSSIRRKHNLPDECDARWFYIQQQKQGLDPIKYYEELLPELKFALELKDEVSMFSDRPSDFLRLLALPPEKIDRTLAFEIHRQGIFVYNAARNNATHLVSRSQTILSDLQHHLSLNLFRGPIGNGQTIYTESIHDDNTNEVIGFPYKDPQIPPTAHLKKVPFTARLIEGFGPVYTSPRKKNDAVTMIKAVASAPEERGEINPDCIKDRIAMEFVPLEACADPEELIERVVELIKSGPYEVEKVLVDNNTDKNRGQSPKTRFVRRIIYFKEFPVAFELKVSGLGDFLNSRLEVGEKDQETKLYNGRGHRLFGLRRALPPARLLYPEEIYADLGLERAFIAQSEKEAHELRNMYKAA